MGWEGWVAIATVAMMSVVLVRNIAGPDTVLMGGLTVFMTLGLASKKFPSPAEAVAGFGNESLVTIAVMFAVAEGLSRTGAMSLLTRGLLGVPKSAGGALTRLLLPVSVMSAFLNNTPIVAMFIPVVNDWCKKTGISPSKLLIPLSYAAILGGTCTLIGTATNLVVQGMVMRAQGEGLLPADVQIGMFTNAAVAVPAALLGITYLIVLGPKLLPDRGGRGAGVADARRYTVEMMVESGSAIDGRTIEQAGLRHLPGAFLVEIERGDDRLAAVGPEQVLHGGDRLIFAGVVESVRDLQKIRGLVPATDQVFKLSHARPDRRLIEAVVSDSCPMIGKSIREGRFRGVYNAAVIAVHRGGEHLKQKIGDIVLHTGDTLLIEAHPRFVDAQRDRRDFFLVSEVPGSEPLRYERAWIALIAMVAMIALASTGTMRLVNAALLATGAMVLAGCYTPFEARNSVNWRVLLTIGAALGIGQTLDTTGAAGWLAVGLVDACEPLGPWGLMLGVYVVAQGMSSLVGPLASAALVFPVALAASVEIGAAFMPFAVTVMMASVASFATPMSYQTNLMVYGAGGYRFSDYLKVGLPLNLLVMGTVLVLGPLIWPF